MFTQVVFLIPERQRQMLLKDLDSPMRCQLAFDRPIHFIEEGEKTKGSRVGKNSREERPILLEKFAL